MAYHCHCPPHASPARVRRTAKLCFVWLMVDATENAARVKSIETQNPRGKITRFAHLADCEYGFCPVDFAQSVAQLRQWYVLAPGTGEFPAEAAGRTSITCAPASASDFTGWRNPSRMFPAANPATFTTSFALPNGGA